MIISFELLGLPRMANPSGKSSHWRALDTERKKWQTFVQAAVLAAGRPPRPFKKAQLVLTRHSSVEPDYDGIVRGFKSVVDGLVLAGVLINDKVSTTGQWDCRWEPCKPRQGKISVTVTERET